MYICICKGITELQLKNKLSCCNSVKQILQCGIGTDCKKCLLLIKQMVKDNENISS